MAMTKTLYYFILTGGPDGLSDIEIPIESFQARIRQGDPTYLSVVIPTVFYAAAINARPNGEMVIEAAHVVREEVLYRGEIARVAFENITIDQGGRNQSVTLVGHKTVTWTPKTVNLTGLAYYNLSQGKKKYRFPIPDLNLRPGDTVIVGSDSFTAGMISYTVSVNQQQMEVSEA